MAVRAAGVGLTLDHIRRGTFGGQTPRVIGHELAGVIVEVGSDVQTPAVGARCAVYFYLNCGHCRWCQVGRETLCVNSRGLVGVHVDGGFSDYVCLPAENFIPIPPSLDFEAAAVTADAICTAWHCMRERACIRPLDDVLLLGAGGGVGIHAVQMAKVFGGRVIAVDISEEKLELARRWGAAETIHGRKEDIAVRALALTGGKGVEAAIDFVGYPETVGAAIQSLAISGRAVIVGVQPGVTMVEARRLVTTEQVITGSRHSTKQELAATLDIVARGEVTAVVGERVPLEEVDILFRHLADESLLGRGAIAFDE
ncbi:MAG: zinc-binding dehydrogenase [Dehalococcoidia bacterium]|nr:zinc-binding dehydrogenase [Dehalococcoidia bacterium]